ncbi:MAG: hypothetical protein M3M97_00670, partial [Actinomycetota bacterium]|nr:hypothetical protein [Actinomycetota bacterium]
MFFFPFLVRGQLVRFPPNGFVVRMDEALEGLEERTPAFVTTGWVLLVPPDSEFFPGLDATLSHLPGDK